MYTNLRHSLSNFFCEFVVSRGGIGMGGCQAGMKWMKLTEMKAIDEGL